MVRHPATHRPAGRRPDAPRTDPPPAPAPPRPRPQPLQLDIKVTACAGCAAAAGSAPGVRGLTPPPVLPPAEDLLPALGPRQGRGHPPHRALVRRAVFGSWAALWPACLPAEGESLIAGGVASGGGHWALSLGAEGQQGTRALRSAPAADCCAALTPPAISPPCVSRPRCAQGAGEPVQRPRLHLELCGAGGQCGQAGAWGEPGGSGVDWRGAWGGREWSGGAPGGSEAERSAAEWREGGGGAAAAPARTGFQMSGAVPC